MSDDIFTLDQLSEKYGASRNTWRGWIASGELVAINLARSKGAKKPRFVVRSADLDTFLATRATGDAARERAGRRRDRRRKTFQEIV